MYEVAAGIGGLFLACPLSNPSTVRLVQRTQKSVFGSHTSVFGSHTSVFGSHTSVFGSHTSVAFQLTVPRVKGFSCFHN